MTTDRRDPVAQAFRSSYAALVDQAPLLDDHVAHPTGPRWRANLGRVLVAALVVLLAVGAGAWLSSGDRDGDVLPVGDQPFEPDVIVFLETRVTDAALAGVRAALEAHPDVRRLVFFSRAETYAEAQRLFADDPQLLAIITPDILSESFRFEAPAEAWATLEAELEAMDGVVLVISGDEVEVRASGG